MADTALRLYPLPAREISSAAIYEEIELPPPRWHVPARPYVILNAVASVDGRTTLYGRSSNIGGEVDRRTMRTLRAKADAVMIGANTLRAEKLSLGLDEFSSGPQPLAVIVTKTGEVPLEANLIVGERQEVLVIMPQHTPSDEMHGLRDGGSVLRVPASASGGVNLEHALEALKTGWGIGVVLVEGGPTLNHSLISSNLADELFLTLAPKLLGGAPPGVLGILNGPVLAGGGVHLLSAHLADDEIFLRYRLPPPHLCN